MNENFYIIFSIIIISLISFVGVLFFMLKEKFLKKILLFLVALSAGSLLGGAFLHLIPEIIREGNFTLNTSLLILGGIILFFVIENFVHWRHCHIPTSKSHPHHLGIINLIGDGIHNLIDGMIVASAYLINIPLGIATTFAVIVHEIPQEIGDFGVLIYAGFSKTKALLFNFGSAVIALLGALIVIFFSGNYENISTIIIPIAVGGFIYIAGSDLIPEIHKRQEKNFSIKNLIAIILGILIMYLLTFLEVA
jgi:zinc and cadmium transporter